MGLSFPGALERRERSIRGRIRGPTPAISFLYARLGLGTESLEQHHPPRLACRIGHHEARQGDARRRAAEKAARLRGGILVNIPLTKPDSLDLLTRREYM